VQANGLPADQRSVVFSFGVVLFEMLTGRQPAARVTRFQFEVGPGGALLPSRQLLTLSPDGGHIVYVANGRLMVRPMAEN
jgi:hypothetical protein